MKSQPKKKSVRPKNPKPLRSLAHWQSYCQGRLTEILQVVAQVPRLKKLGPKVDLRKKQKHSPILQLPIGGKKGKSKGRFAEPWLVEVQVVGQPTMLVLNRSYKKKSYPTDILSFPSPAFFFHQGVLGELILCLPVLRAQAAHVEKELKRWAGKQASHTLFAEFDVVLVHGVLHLLGLDHDLGAAQAQEMADFEIQVLKKLHLKSSLGELHLGLIQRVASGMKPK
ncbi:MAG: rRNA maturation RNase YbeY [Bdellovibrionia bacterium]